MLDKSSTKIKKMFDKISKRYDFMNNLISFKTHLKIKKNCIKNLNIKPHKKVLDLCTGTGDIAHFVKKIQPEAEIFGVDFSKEMLNIAKKKNKDIDFIEADILDLPFEDESFDYIIVSFGLRNVEDIDKALLEIKRILKKDGMFLNLDFFKSNFISKIFDLIVLIFAFLFSSDFSGYLYLLKSKSEFLSVDEFIKKFYQTGFKIIKNKNYVFKIISSQIATK